MWSKQYIFKLASEFSTIAIFYFASEPPQKRMVCSKMAPFNEKWKTGSQGFAFIGSESIFKPSNFQLPLGFILSYAFLS